MYGKIDKGKVTIVSGKRIKINSGVIINPTITQLNAHGIYKVVTIEEDGESHLQDNVIYHYIGKPSEETNI